MDYQSTNQSSQKKTTYTVALVVLAILGLIIWYFYSSQKAAPKPSALEQSSIPAVGGGNTTADITKDLKQIPDDSAALNQDFNSLNKDIQSF